MDGLGAPTEDVKLQLLQLRCIIDAKDREIQLLRTHLSGQEQDTDSMAAYKAEITHLRGEVQRLTTERDALRTQPAASPQAASSASDGGAPAGMPQLAAVRPSLCSGGGAAYQANMGDGGPSNSAPTLTDGRSHPMSPGAGTALDPAALVDKLRSLVSNLVAEALAAQQRSPNLLQHQHHTHSTTASARHPLASTQAPRHQVEMGRSAGRSFWGAVEQLQAATPVVPVPQTGAPQANRSTVLSGNTTAVDPHSSGVRMSLPGVLVHIVPAPPLPLSLHPTPAAVAEGRTQRHSSAASASGYAAGGAASGAAPSFPLHDITGRGAADGSFAAAMGAAAGVRAPASGVPVAAPAVLELNVDGTTVYAERAVLESQTAGSRLHHMLITEYGRLPLDAQGRPFLSYEPRVFQMLLGHLKERYLFGRPVAAGESHDWSRHAESLGVSPLYLAQVASHFGLTDPVPLPPPPQQQQQQRQSQAGGAAACMAAHNVSTSMVAPAPDLIATTTSITSVASGVPIGALPNVASITSSASLVHIGSVSSAAAGIAAPFSSAASASSVASPGPIPTAPAEAPTATAVAAEPSGPIATSGSRNPFVDAGSIGPAAPVDPILTAAFAGSIATTASNAATAPASTGPVPRVGAAGAVNSVASAAPITPAASAASIASPSSAAPIPAGKSVGPVAPPSLPAHASAGLSPSLAMSPQAPRQAPSPDPVPIGPCRGSQGSLTGAPNGSAAAGGLPPAGSGVLEGQPWGQLPSLRVPVQPRDSSRGVDTDASNGSSSSMQQSPSAAAVGLLQRKVPSPVAVQDPERSLAPATRPVLDGAGGAPAATVSSAAAGAVANAVASLVGPHDSGAGCGSASALQSPLSANASFQSPSQQHSTALRTVLPSSPSSRIPPPPPQHKPAAAPSLSPAGSAPSVGSLTPQPASGSQDIGSLVPGWWQPFSDEPAQGAVVAAASQPQSSQAAPAPVASLTAAASAKVTVTDEISAGGPSASVVSGAISAAALGEQYRVGNLYAILAEKRRGEAEAEGNA